MKEKNIQSNSHFLGKVIKVMLVDDHSFIIDGIKSRIADNPEIKIVAEASNGLDAISLLKKVSPDVILMDIQMPVMNGYEATQKITAHNSHIKIIALSSFDERALIEKMLLAGASGYVLKNIKTPELLTAIHAVFNGEKYFCSDISITLAQPEANKILEGQKTQLAVPLSDREREIVRLIAQGMTNSDIAKKLFISITTVDTHRSNIMKKLNVHNVVGIVRFAIQNKLVE